MCVIPIDYFAEFNTACAVLFGKMKNIGWHSRTRSLNFGIARHRGRSPVLPLWTSQVAWECSLKKRNLGGILHLRLNSDLWETDSAQVPWGKDEKNSEKRVQRAWSCWNGRNLIAKKINYFCVNDKLLFGSNNFFTEKQFMYF